MYEYIGLKEGKTTTVRRIARAEQFIRAVFY